jgi:hypothetical protein
MSIRFEHVRAQDLPDDVACRPWRSASVALEPLRLRSPDVGGRWSISFAVAWNKTRPIGIVPLCQYHGKAFASPIYDPAAIAPRMFSDAQVTADQYLFIGGAADLVSGVAVLADLSRTDAEETRSALVDAAFHIAAHDNLVGVALYVRDAELPAFIGRGDQRDHEAVSEFSSIHVTGSEMAAYLGSLSHGKRSVVRRDLQRISEAGLLAAEVPLAEVIDEASHLIVAVKNRHATMDHPLLTQLRLTEWSRSSVGVPVAFSVRNDSGRLIAVSFGCHRSPSLEMYEVGLADDPVDRHLAYTEVLVYAPIRYALRESCTQLDLGLGSTTPKRLRGAHVSTVWAVGEAGGPGWWGTTSTASG